MRVNRATIVVFVLISLIRASQSKPKWKKVFEKVVVTDIKRKKSVRTKCHCVANKVNPATGTFPNSKCKAIKGYDLMQFKDSKNGYQADLMAKLIGRPADFRQVEIPATSFACVDGREPQDDQSLHILGGDFVEFLYFLQAHYENFGLSQELCDTLFQGYLKTMRKEWFYYHTDLDAVNRLKRLLMRKHDWDIKDELDLSNPPPDVLETLKFNIIKAEYQGCLHLRMMMFYPERYGVKLEVIQKLLISYFSLLWNKDMRVAAWDAESDSMKMMFLHTKLKFVVSVGHHQEGAWVTSEDQNECLDEKVAAIIPPHHSYPHSSKGKFKFPKAKDHEPQIAFFVENPRAARIQRKETALWFNTKDDAINVDEWAQLIEDKAVKATQWTKKFLVKDIPEYVVTAKFEK